MSLHYLLEQLNEHVAPNSENGNDFKREVLETLDKQGYDTEFSSSFMDEVDGYRRSVVDYNVDGERVRVYQEDERPGEEFYEPRAELL